MPFGGGLKRQFDVAIRSQIPLKQGRIKGIDNVIDIGKITLCLAQAIVYGVIRQLLGRKWYWPLAMFDTGEPFLLHCSQYYTVSHQRGGTIVKSCV